MPILRAPFQSRTFPPMTTLYDVAAIGNAIVDVIAPASDDFLAEEGLVKGSMALIDDARATSLYARMAAGIEASGGSAGNTVAGIASLGRRGVHISKVARATRWARSTPTTWTPSAPASPAAGWRTTPPPAAV